jgi:hypothetical protein
MEDLREADIEETPFAAAVDTALGGHVDGLVGLERSAAGLRAGDFSFRHAKAIVAHAMPLPDELHAGFEQAVVPSASVLTYSKFDLKARKVRESMDAATIKERHEKSLADRETCSWTGWWGTGPSSVSVPPLW